MLPSIRVSQSHLLHLRLPRDIGYGQDVSLQYRTSTTTTLRPVRSPTCSIPFMSRKILGNSYMVVVYTLMNNVGSTRSILTPQPCGAEGVSATIPASSSTAQATHDAIQTSCGEMWGNTQMHRLQQQSTQRLHPTSRHISEEHAILKFGRRPNDSEDARGARIKYSTIGNIITLLYSKSTS